MDQFVGVIIGGMIALGGQAGFAFAESRKAARHLDSQVRGSARLVRDEVSACMEALHATLRSGDWWGTELEPRLTTTVDDRRTVASHIDAETLRRTFGSLRRFGQLQATRAQALDAAAESLGRSDLVDAVAAFLDLAVARRGLSSITGYGSGPFARPLEIDPQVLSEALQAVGLPSADGLYQPAAPSAGGSTVDPPGHGE